MGSNPTTSTNPSGPSSSRRDSQVERLWIELPALTTATLSIVGWNGDVLSGPSGLTTIPPGEMRLWAHTTTTWAYCKAVVSGLKTDWRGAFELQAWINSTYETRVSVPLQ